MKIIWKKFSIGSIANIYAGKRLTKLNMRPGSIPFIGASDANNGVTAFVSNINSSLDSNVLGVNYNGSVVENFYHYYSAIFSDDVKRLHLKNHTGNKFVYLYLKSSILKQKSKYQYSYKFNEERLKRQLILLPTTNGSTPDYKFIENQSKKIFLGKTNLYKIYAEKLIENLTFKKIPPLGEKKWGEFNLRKVFPEIQRGKRLKKENQIHGNIPYISSTSLSNGVDNFISNTNSVRSFNNCLTIANSGSVGSTFYHPYDFIASDHVTHLKNLKFDKYSYLFVASIISRLSEKYNFNREINDTRISREKILLPLDDDGLPDYNYMSQYSKNIFITKIKEYLDYLKVAQKEYN